jgi:hypothetical protein
MSPIAHITASQNTPEKNAPLTSTDLEVGTTNGMITDPTTSGKNTATQEAMLSTASLSDNLTKQVSLTMLTTYQQYWTTGTAHNQFFSNARVYLCN